jgi:ABC-type sugar transport system substrate-binding protein
MADYTFPDDLVQLQRDYYAADARCEKLAAALPPGTAVLAGEATVNAENQEAYEAARAERLRLVTELYAHPWWDGLEKGARLKAKEALEKAAREGSAAAE